MLDGVCDAGFLLGVRFVKWANDGVRMDVDFSFR